MSVLVIAIAVATHAVAIDHNNVGIVRYFCDNLVHNNFFFLLNVHFSFEQLKCWWSLINMLYLKAQKELYFIIWLPSGRNGQEEVTAVAAAGVKKRKEEK